MRPRTNARIILIGCGKLKRPERSPAAELYTGPLFTDRLTYAESTKRPFYIVSARYGLIAPNVLIDPYDLTVDQLTPVERGAWSLGVVMGLINELSDDCDLSRLSIELHMGAAYAEPIRQLLPAVGINYSWPVKGLGQGEQRGWYATNTKFQLAAA